MPATVAHGWSKNFQDILSVFGIHLPKALANSPFDYDPATGHFFGTGSVLDLPGIAIAVLVTWVLVIGIKESARFNTTMVAIKVAIVLFVIGVGAFYVDSANWHPFAPYGYTGMSFFGHTLFGQTDKGGQPLGMLFELGLPQLNTLTPTSAARPTDVSTKSRVRSQSACGPT